MRITRMLSGSFEATPEEQKLADVPSSLDKKALLVYEGKFESMDGPVDITKEHIEQLASEHNSTLAKLSRFATGEVPLKMMPPIQLDHSTSAKDTVGRLIGNLEVGEHEGVSALYGNMRVLGKENVQKVLDGRWTHLSIGADLEKNKLTELTITPFPAAPQASMLSKMAGEQQKKKVKETSVGQWLVEIYKTDHGYSACAYDPVNRDAKVEVAGKSNEKDLLDEVTAAINRHENAKLKGDTMYAQLKAYLMGFKKLSEQEVDKKLAESTDEEKKKLAAEAEDEEKKKLKKHLMEHKKMSEEDADKHMAGLDEHGRKELSAEVSEHEKKMGIDSGKHDPIEHMSAENKAEAARLMSDLRASQDTMRLALNKSKILSRLSKLKAQAKVTPAEIKKMDIAALSKENDATINAVLKSYEALEPKVFLGLAGTSKASNVAEVSKKARMAEMEQRIRMNMPSIAPVDGGKDKEKQELGVHDAKHDPIEHMSYDMDGAHKSIMEMMDKDVGKAKEMLEMHHAEMKKRMSGGDTTEHDESQEKSHEGLEESMKKMQTQLEALCKLTSK